MPAQDSTSSDGERRAGPIGRWLRVAGGALILASLVGPYVNGTRPFVFRSMAVIMGLVVVYMLVHRHVMTRAARVGRWTGAVVALVPLVAVFILGGAGGPILGAGEGQVGALSFLGVSLLLAGLRGDGGCEVMAIPNALSGRRSHLGCLVFSPIDRLERRWSAARRAR